MSGWLIEESDQYCYYGYCSNASEGGGIMQIFLITQLYPIKESGLFAKAGGGYVEKEGQPETADLHQHLYRIDQLLKLVISDYDISTFAEL